MTRARSELIEHYGHCAATVSLSFQFHRLLNRSFSAYKENDGFLNSHANETGAANSPDNCMEITAKLLSSFANLQHNGRNLTQGIFYKMEILLVHVKGLLKGNVWLNQNIINECWLIIYFRIFSHNESN